MVRWWRGRILRPHSRSSRRRSPAPSVLCRQRSNSFLIFDYQNFHAFSVGGIIANSYRQWRWSIKRNHEFPGWGSEEEGWSLIDLLFFCLVHRRHAGGEVVVGDVRDLFRDLVSPGGMGGRCVTHTFSGTSRPISVLR